MNRSEVIGAAQQHKGAVYIIEAQPRRTYEEVGGKKNISHMGISYVALVEHPTDRISVYSESEIMACLDAIASAHRIVGYHLDKFIFPLLSGYRNIDVSRLHRLDLLDYISRKIGRKIELNDLLFGTLGIKRSVDPMKMARLFQQGKNELVEQATVQVAKDLAAIYRWGKEKGYVILNGPFDQRWKISVAW